MTLDEFLVDSGWTKAEVARRLSISEAAVSQWTEIPKLRLATLEIMLGRTEKSESLPVDGYRSTCPWLA